MATTTPNYGWTVPTSTDLVKDGATAIETLGDAIDASMNTALGTKKAGMVLLNTTSFSGVASQSVNDVFSATYDNYKVVLRLTAASTNLAVNFRYRVSGADNSTSNYNKIGWYVGNDSSSGVNNLLAQTQFQLGNFNTTAPTYHLHEMLISSPFATEYTLINDFTLYRASSGPVFSEFTSNYFGATTSFTGFSIIASTGNFTGSVSTFGINK
jgi:hypothetical protein